VHRVVVWQRVDAVGAEYAEVATAPLRLAGEVVLADGDGPCVVTYEVVCDDAGITSRASLRVKRPGGVATRTLARAPDGTWRVGDRPAPEFAGLADVDLSVTPSTNTLPLRRLRLAVGQTVEVVAVWVVFPSLDVVPLRQRYRRVDAHLYDYESPEHGFRAPITVDEEALVITYGGLWRRAEPHVPAA
jgi:hypothetical protein